MKHGKKYLHEPKPGMLYVRVRGRYLGRITASPGTEEFDRQYWEILSGKRVEAKTSWRALIQDFRHSDYWRDNYKPRTRKDYEKVFDYIEEKTGNRDVSRLQRKDVIAAMEANRHRVRFANYIAQVMSVLIEHAIDIGWRRDNPAKGVRKLSTPKEKQRPHNLWPDWAVERWRAEADFVPRLAFEIGVGTLQRPSDWLKFRWSDYDGSALRLIGQGKTDKPLWLPCTAHLKAALDAAPRKGLTILTRPNGAPMDYDHLSKEVMLRERTRLGLRAYDLHALRYRGAMELAWAGCDDDEIAAYSGHDSKAMIRKYAGVARQMMRARQAQGKRR